MVSNGVNILCFLPKKVVANLSKSAFTYLLLKKGVGNMKKGKKNTLMHVITYADYFFFRKNKLSLILSRAFAEIVKILAVIS